jgi:capsular polysaccharide export protein
MKYSNSKRLVQNTKSFLNIKYYNLLDKLLNKSGIFYGWGRKKSGQKAIELSKKHNNSFILLEDGFIRSLNLGVNDSPTFSIVEDKIGIYYDATTASTLENILNTYDFENDKYLMHTAKEAMMLIKKHHISKYNNAPNIDENYFKNDSKDKILIIAQTEGDSSLVYGLADNFSTKEMIEDALKQNPNASVYIKIHPDVLAGKKHSDIIKEDIPASCRVIDEDVNPISLLKHFKKVYTKTSGMGMEALVLGLDVVCYGLPYYAGWGLTTDKQSCKRRKRNLRVEELFAGAYILYTRYHNPYSHKESNIIDTIQTIAKYRNLTKENDGTLYFFGFSRWKRKNTKFFFSPLNQNKMIFASSLEDAQKKGLTSLSKIYIWGKKPFIEVESYAKEQNIPLLRVEDGFVRSVSLGSDLTKAYSLVVDSRGIYFDPRSESDLEYILNTYEFDNEIIDRSKKLQQYLIANKISKYNMHKDKKLVLDSLKEGQTVIMVPGQVEDDASIIYGAKGMTNLELLQQTRKNAPDAYIIYKPHPDVLAGNRKGNIPNDTAVKYCNSIIADASLDSVLALADEVHTMTSLVGFEALIRGKKVTTYGLPFYTGWGLTKDTKPCERHKKARTLDELVAAAFILYPRYIHPHTNELCEIEVLLKEIDKEKHRYNTNKTYKLYINSRNYVSRKIQLVLKVLLGE